ncbi:MAG: hypothetical protein DRH11_12695, partial [Deltaproteobacteria bacterium]
MISARMTTVLNFSPEEGISECRKRVFAIAALFILILIIYSNTFRASWHFDDEHTIMINPRLHLEDLSWKNIKNTFYSKDYQPEKLYRPVACLSFALNYYLGKLNVLGYHLVNLAIHFITSVFLFLFIYQVLRLPSLGDKYLGNSYFIALLSSVLWAINPVQVQAVTY